MFLMLIVFVKFKKKLFSRILIETLLHFSRQLGVLLLRLISIKNALFIILLSLFSLVALL